MVLSSVHKRVVEQEVGRYCKERVLDDLRNHIRMGYRIRGDTVTIFEERPAFDDPSEWIEFVVAQMRFKSSSGRWRLFCADRNSRWHPYDGISDTPEISDLLDEIDRDPTGIFWG